MLFGYWETAKDESNLYKAFYDLSCALKTKVLQTNFLVVTVTTQNFDSASDIPKDAICLGYEALEYVFSPFGASYLLQEIVAKKEPKKKEIPALTAETIIAVLNKSPTPINVLQGETLVFIL